MDGMCDTAHQHTCMWTLERAFVLVGILKLLLSAQLSATLNMSWQTCYMTSSASYVPGKQQRLASGHPVLPAE